jgi:hypothetical protein
VPPVAAEGREKLPADYVRSLGLSTTALAVGLLVIGVQLEVACETTLYSSGALGCSFPFQGYGLWFLLASGIVTIVSANLFAVSIEPPNAKGADPTVRYVRSIVLAVAFVSLTLLMAFILNLL